MRIHSAIEIRPHLLHFDVGLIDAPRVIRRFEMGSASLLQFWCIVLHSAVDRGVIDVETALEHHFLQISIAERIAQIPAYAEQNNLSFNMTPFERGEVSITQIPLSRITPSLQDRHHCCNTTWGLSSAAPSAIPRSSALRMRRDETSWICGACASFRSARRHSPSSKKASVSQNELKQTPAVLALTVSRWACSWLSGSARQSLPKHVLPASSWFSRSDTAFLHLFCHPRLAGRGAFWQRKAFWLPCSCARWRSTGNPPRVSATDEFLLAA